MNEKEIIQCVSDCLNGNKESFNLIFKFYKKKIFNLCYHYIGIIPDAEDAAVEVLFKVYNSLKKFDNRYKFSTWIYKIAYNYSIEILRKKKREDKYINSGSFRELKFVEKDTPSTQLFELNKKENFKEELKKIPKNFQEVLMLKYYHDLSYQQISEIMNLPKNTVGILILRAKKALKKQIVKEDYYE